jgi:hypothetical protein
VIYGKEDKMMNKTMKMQGVMLAGAFLLAVTATMAETRGCYIAEVPGTMVLPDGSEHPAGALRICADLVISPVSSLHKISVGGRPVGMFLSVPRSIEENVEAGTAQFVFRRTPRGELNLVGYVVSARNGTTLYEMQRVGARRKAADTANADVAQRGERFVLVANAR